MRISARSPPGPRSSNDARVAGERRAPRLTATKVIRTRFEPASAFGADVLTTRRSARFGAPLAAALASSAAATSTSSSTGPSERARALNSESFRRIAGRS